MISTMLTLESLGGAVVDVDGKNTIAPAALTFDASNIILLVAKPVAQSLAQTICRPQGHQNRAITVPKAKK